MLQKTINFLSVDLIDTKENLNDLHDIYNFMDNILKLAKLNIIYKPVLIPYYHGKIKNDCGISCYAFFDGGYSTIHIFEKRKIAYFDIMSTKQFNKQIIIDTVSNFCGAKDILLNSNDSILNQSQQSVFGPHYIGLGKIKKNFNMDDLLNLQTEIITKIGMTPIIAPTILKNNNSTLLFIAIAESHIALTLTKDALQVDIFSCKLFDIGILKNLLNDVVDIQSEELYYRLYKA